MLTKMLCNSLGHNDNVLGIKVSNHNDELVFITTHFSLAYAMYVEDDDADAKGV